MPRRRTDSEPTTSSARLTAVTARVTISLSISATMRHASGCRRATTSCSWKAAFATPNALGVLDRLLLLVDRAARSFLTAAACARAARRSPSRRSARADPGPRRRRPAATLRACSTSAAVRAVIRSSGSWTTTPPRTPRTTVMRPSASRMRSASRSDGRDTPNRSTRSGSWPSESPSVSLPETIRDRSSSAMSCGFSRGGRVVPLRGRHHFPSKKNAVALPYNHPSRTSSGRSRAAASPRQRSIDRTG